MNIEVWADWHFLAKPKIVGILSVGSSGKHEVFNFEYAKEWLEEERFQIDPRLQLFKGRYYSDQTPNFGIFLDSSPDRWGRRLVQRKRALSATSQGRKAKSLAESDYLLAVPDLTRMGGLRFKFGGEFQDSDIENPTPPWTSLRELQSAAGIYEESEDDEAVRQEIKQLFAPGTSLGGARPKANVIDEDSSLWIAKFPSKDDGENTEAWEFVVHCLARSAGLDVPEARLEAFASDYNTLLVKRFDRQNEKRIHFTSAMTALERKDGDEGASYLELVDVIIERGEPSRVDADLEELWRRIVFSIAVSNTDDHLRNHGFLMLNRSGLRLSPAYDMNPNRYGSGLKLNIDYDSSALSFSLAKSVADQFRIPAKKATGILDQVTDSVSNWRKIANEIGLSKRDCDWMANAFRISD